MYKADRVLANIFGLKRALEDLVVSSVHGVATLEGNNVRVGRQLSTQLVGRLARKDALRKRQTGDLAADIEGPALKSNHANGRMGEGGIAIAVVHFGKLVRRPDVRDINGGDGFASVVKADAVAGVEVVAICVKHNRESKQGAIGELHVVHNAGVLLAAHEARERGETAV
jgi:hypothetical protein